MTYLVLAHLKVLRKCHAGAKWFGLLLVTFVVVIQKALIHFQCADNFDGVLSRPIAKPNLLMPVVTLIITQALIRRLIKKPAATRIWVRHFAPSGNFAISRKKVWSLFTLERNLVIHCEPTLHWAWGDFIACSADLMCRTQQSWTNMTQLFLNIEEPT